MMARGVHEPGPSIIFHNGATWNMEGHGPGLANMEDHGIALHDFWILLTAYILA